MMLVPPYKYLFFLDFRIRLSTSMEACDETKRTLIRNKMIEITSKRGPEKTCCPSEVVRSLFSDWRKYMDACREMAWELQKEGVVEVCQGGVPVQPPVQGPIRIRTKTSAKK